MSFIKLLFNDHIVYLEGGCKFNKDNYYIFSKIAKVLSRLLIYCSGQI